MQLFKKPHNKLNPSNQNKVEETKLQLDNQYYQINRNFLIITQLFLSAPMGIQKPRENIHQRDRLLYSLHLVWCLSVYSFLVYCVYDEYTSRNRELPTIQKPLFFSEYLVYLMHLLEFIRMINFCGDKFFKFQIFILDFDRNLCDMKVRIHYRDLQRFLRQHLALILLHIITCAIIGYFYNDGEIANLLRSNTVYLLPNVIIHISLLQYYALLFIVYKRGEKLYFLLEELLKKSSSYDAWMFRHQLNVIRNLFAKLDEFTRTVNDHFSISICLVYLGSFINIGVNLFLLYKYLNDWGRSNSSWILYSLAWTCMHIGKMFLILYYNQRVQNMKSKATILLSSFEFEHQEAETTLRLFILQLMSDTRSNYVCGMAALNMSFITSLLVGISTLFIFLVQYDITYEALTSSHNSGGHNK